LNLHIDYIQCSIYCIYYTKIRHFAAIEVLSTCWLLGNGSGVEFLKNQSGSSNFSSITDEAPAPKITASASDDWSPDYTALTISLLYSSDADPKGFCPTF
jgi:hypothetical protein